jgi:hypothetical protein
LNVQTFADASHAFVVVKTYLEEPEYATVAAGAVEPPVHSTVGTELRKKLPGKLIVMALDTPAAYADWSLKPMVTMALAVTAATLATRWAGVIEKVTPCTCPPKLPDNGAFATALSMSLVVSTLTRSHGATMGREAVVKPPKTMVTDPAGISAVDTVAVPCPPAENETDVKLVVEQAVGLHVTLVTVAVMALK